MRRLLLCIILSGFFLESFAQAPDKMSFQAIVRRTNNQVVNEQTVGMQISILQGSLSGTAIFIETHTSDTDRNGVVSIEIGGGIASLGSFAAIDWANGPYFIKTEIDIDGGTAYSIEGVSQLLTVPYAKVADRAGQLINGEQDPVFQSSIAQGITGADTARWNNSGSALDSAGIAALGFVAGPKTVDTTLDSAAIAALGYVAGERTVDTTLDSAAIVALGFVAGPHTTDIQIDSAGIAALGYVAGPKTVDTQIDSTRIAALGYVAGDHTVDTRLDSAEIAALGYVAGPHTVDTQIDSAGIATLGFVAGAKTIDTQLDSADIAALGYVAGVHTVDTTLDSAAIAAMGFVANPQLFSGTETDPLFSASPASSITIADLVNWNTPQPANLDNDPNNEIQVLSYSNGVLTLSNGGGSINVNLLPTGIWVPAPVKSGNVYYNNPCQTACPEGYAAATDSRGFLCQNSNGDKGWQVTVSTSRYNCNGAFLTQCHCVRVK